MNNLTEAYKFTVKQVFDEYDKELPKNYQNDDDRDDDNNYDDLMATMTFIKVMIVLLTERNLCANFTIIV